MQGRAELRARENLLDFSQMRKVPATNDAIVGRSTGHTSHPLVVRYPRMRAIGCFIVAEPESEDSLVDASAPTESDTAARSGRRGWAFVERTA